MGTTQLTFDETLNAEIINNIFSEAKMPPFVKGNQWLVKSFGRESM